MPTITIHEKELIKKPEESDSERIDRENLKKFRDLNDKKKRSKQEQNEYLELKEKISTKYLLRNGYLPEHFADKDLKALVKRVHEELANQYGIDTPLKMMLINRLVSAWSQAHTYERMLHFTKYKENEDGTYSWHISHERTGYLKEIRRGIESSNDQIIRLSQALQNLASPPLQIKVKNAMIAQNMQINQGIPSPKDLEKSSESKNNAEIIT